MLYQNNTLKTLFTLLFFTISSSIFSQTKLISWNLENFGKSKSHKTINFIANSLQNYDVIAIQEIVAGNGGKQAVAKLVEKLNKNDKNWEYVVSEPTSSSAYKTERYAFIWNTTKIKKIGEAWLEKKYHKEIDREPYYCTFQYKNKQFTIANFHAITKSRQPETEIKYFKFLPAEYPQLNLIFTGDFNCPQSHTVFIPLKKMGYHSVLINQKTSLKKKSKNGKYLASEFDNMFYNHAKVINVNSGVVRFYKSFYSLQDARKISDHIPIWFEFSLN